MKLFRIKRHMKKGLALLLYLSGLSQFLINKKLSGKCLVLMYHRVLPDKKIDTCSSHRSIVMSERIFEMQMRYFASHFKPMTINTMSEHFSNNIPFQKNILITFDDGWRDNYEYALPILSKYSLTPLIFLTSGFIGTGKRFWQEHLTEMIWKVVLNNRNKNKVLKSIFPGIDTTLFDGNNQDKIKEAIALLIQNLKEKEYKEITQIFERMKEDATDNVHHCKSKKTIDDFLSWNQIGQMIKQKVDFGSHGVNHYILTKENIDIDYEFTESKDAIEKNANIRINTVSYPNGNFNVRVIEKAYQAGYRIGFTTQPGYVHHLDHPLKLKRININEEVSSTIPLLFGRILGLW